MGKVERKFDEAVILKYKETGDESLFELLINDRDIKNYISYVCYQKLRNAPTTLYSHEDFMSLSYLVLWQSIHKYKFICPCCGLQAKTHAAYKLHTVAKHGQYYEPSVSITRYIKFNIGAYLQNEIRREYSLERKSNVMTLNVFSPDDKKGEEDSSSPSSSKVEFDIVDEYLIENEVVFKDSIKSLLETFDPLSKEIFNYLYDEKMKQSDIAIILYNDGRYSSEQSAAVVVSRIIKNKINPAIRNIYPELTL